MGDRIHLQYSYLVSAHILHPTNTKHLVFQIKMTQNPG